MVSDMLFGLGIGALFAVVGLSEVYRGYGRYREASSVTGAEVTPIADIEPGGTVAVEGTVRAVDDRRVESPLFGERGLVVGTEVDAVSTTGDKRPVAVHRGVRSRPFIVEDDTGSVRVEVPEAATVDPAETTGETYVFGRDELPEDAQAAAEKLTGSRMATAPPEHIKEYHREVEDLEDPEEVRSGFRGTADRRYREGAIDPGDEVYVQGQAVERAAEWGERGLAIAGGDAPGSVSVVEGGPEEYGSWLDSVRVFGRIAMGVLFAVAGIGVIAVVLVTGG